MLFVIYFISYITELDLYVYKQMTCFNYVYHVIIGRLSGT